MNKNINILNRILRVCRILIKEQLNEPFAFLWILASPVAMFYFYINQPHQTIRADSYIHYSGWFYGYVAITVSMFGFSYYLIGRRESGFVRSFIYHRRAQAYYLSAHFCAYSIIAVFYANLFYLATKPAFGSYYLKEAIQITINFYVAFFSLCGAASLFSLIPIKFSSAGMLFSALSLSMIALSGARQQSDKFQLLEKINPLFYLEKITTGDLGIFWIGAILIMNGIAFLITILKFRVNPVWNRY